MDSRPGVAKVAKPHEQSDTESGHVRILIAPSELPTATQECLVTLHKNNQPFSPAISVHTVAVSTVMLVTTQRSSSAGVLAPCTCKQSARSGLWSFFLLIKFSWDSSGCWRPSALAGFTSQHPSNHCRSVQPTHGVIYSCLNFI